MFKQIEHSFLGASVSSFSNSCLQLENEQTMFPSFKETNTQRFPHLRKRIKHVSALFRFLNRWCNLLMFLLWFLSQRISLLFQSDRGFLYYSSPTEDSLLFISQRIYSLFQSDRGIFIIPLSEDFFTILVRQRILYYSSLRGFLHYSSPTKDSFIFWENE